MAVPRMTTVSTVLPRQAALGAVMSKELLVGAKASIGAHTGVKPGRHVLGREHSSTSVYLFVTFLSALARMVMPRYL